MFKKALQRVKNIASQAQQSPTKSLAGMGAAMRSGSGLTPMPVARQSQQSPVSSGSMMGAFQPVVRAPGQPVQVQNTSGTPAGLAGMGGGRGLSESQLSGLRNNLGPQVAPANAAAMMNSINTGMGARPSSVGGMKKGGKVKVSSASKRADGIATKGKTRGRMV